MKKKSTSQPVRRSLGEGGSAPVRHSSWLAGLSRRSFSEDGSFRRMRLGEGGPRRAVASREGGFFNLRVLIGLVVVLAGVFLALIGFGTFSKASAQANVGSPAGQTQQAIGQQVGQMTVIPAVHSDLSPALRDQPVVWRQRREPPEHRKIRFKYKGAPDPVIQSSLWQQPLTTTPAIPAPIRQWEGMGSPCHGCSGGEGPPDTNGAVGKTQYVEMVNVAIQVFDKRTGTSLLGPFPLDSVWFGFGGACEVNTEGDPVVVYDKFADRWIISQFATRAGSETVQNECIAVSQTGDATGAWYRYDFHLTSLFLDYPKFGVWPDGYYMSANMFETGENGDFVAPQPFVFDRAKMLVGDPAATAQTPGLIGLPQQEDPFLPSDLDGILPPPPGDPNHFVEVSGEGEPDPHRLKAHSAILTSPQVTNFVYKVWAFHVDWDHSANSSFTLQATIPARGLTGVSCVDEKKEMTQDCVPQKGTTNKLDSLSGGVMFRNAYRRFPDGRESMLNNLTVKAKSVAGIRWFELRRRLPGNWTIRQQSTYAPDNTWRWMGSIASDNQGNIALGFSASSPTIFPQIRYAGRRATDPLNMLSGEQHLFDGTFSQQAPFSGWGDYSDMTVDPVDDCTFYYTNEYWKLSLARIAWRTHIGYFRFAQCTSPQKGTGHFVVRFACDPSTPVSNALVSIDGFSYGTTLADGAYDAVLPPGPHGYVVSSPLFATQTGTFTITNGQTTPVGVCLAGRAAVADFNGDGHPDYVLRNTSTRQTSIWYLNNNVFIGSAYGPTIPAPWALWGVADFNQDSHPDYGVLEASGNRTAILYLLGPTVIGAAVGPPLPAGWTLVATADFNGDSYPDYVLYNTNTRQTAIWYLNNNVYIGGAFGPPLPAGWALVAGADFNGDGHPDYLLYNMNIRQTAIWYLNNNVYIGGAFGPPLPVGWALVAAADFNGDGHPDYVLYNWRTTQTAIWYLNNNTYIDGAWGPNLFTGWSLIGP